MPKRKTYKKRAPKRTAKKRSHRRSRNTTTSIVRTTHNLMIAQHTICAFEFDVTGYISSGAVTNAQYLIGANCLTTINNMGPNVFGQREIQLIMEDLDYQMLVTTDFLLDLYNIAIHKRV